jgi:hypothetical protein
VHSRYRRTLADLPWHGLRVRLKVCVRRFFRDVPDAPGGSSPSGCRRPPRPTPAAPYVRRVPSRPLPLRSAVERVHGSRRRWDSSLGRPRCSQCSRRSPTRHRSAGAAAARGRR